MPRLPKRGPFPKSYQQAILDNIRRHMERLASEKKIRWPH